MQAGLTAQACQKQESAKLICLTSRVKIPPNQPAPGGGTCPRCGSAASTALCGEICLRCAAECLLSFEADDRLTKPTAARVGPDAVPERIGSYTIIDEIGRGGMGRVFAAQHSGLGRIVALKVMNTGGIMNADLELRFLREAQTAARLRHPNIVPLHDFGRADGHVFFSMDYMDGGDLAVRLRTRPFASWEAAGLVRKVALAVAYAHGEGVLHRDLKPSNILLEGDEPRLADFGLATQLEPGGDLTAVSAVLGTPHYLAPEALRSGSAALTVASDIYALGVVLFELLTGRTPFAGTPPAALPAVAVDSEAPSTRLLSPGVPRDLDIICLACLERDPKRRYPSAAALAEDLRRFLDGESILARPVSGAGRFVRWCRRRPALAAIWMLVSALAVGSTSAAFWIRHERTNTEIALAKVTKAEAGAREQLREARLGEARAVRRTTQPGRRAAALAALADAARIRPGPDLRDEALAALTIPDVEVTDTWEVPVGGPREFTPAPDANFLAAEETSALGGGRSPADLWKRGEKIPFARMELPGVGIVGALRFSRDGTFVMARYNDYSLRVWRPPEKLPVCSITNRPSPASIDQGEIFNDDYDFSPDSQTIALGLPGKGVSLHHASDGREIARWEEGDLINRVRFSPTGTQLAAMNFARRDVRDVYILNVPAMTLMRRLPVPSSPNSIAWSLDGRLLAIALSDNSIIMFDAASGRVLDRMAAGHRSPTDIAFFAHDAMLAVRGIGSQLHVLSAALGREELVMDSLGPGSAAVAIGIDHGQSLAFASLFGVLTRWKVQPPLGWEILPASDPDGFIGAFNNDCIDFSVDGRVIFSSHGRYVLAREVGSGHVVGLMDTGEQRGAERGSISVIDGGRTLVRVSDLTGTWLADLEYVPDGRVEFVKPHPVDNEPGFMITDRARGGTLLALVDPLRELAKVVEIQRDQIKVINRWAVPGPSAATFGPDGTQVLVTCSGAGPDSAAQRIKLWRISDAAVLREFDVASAGEAAWNGLGQTAMTSNGQEESILWNTKDWSIRARLKGELGGSTTTFALSPDGAMAVVTSGDRIHLVSTADGAVMGTLVSPDSTGLTSGIRFLPDRRRFAVMWNNARIDIIDPAALNRGLEGLGLAWAVPTVGK